MLPLCGSFKTWSSNSLTLFLFRGQGALSLAIDLASVTARHKVMCSSFHSLPFGVFIQWTQPPWLREPRRLQNVPRGKKQKTPASSPSWALSSQPAPTRQLCEWAFFKVDAPALHWFSPADTTGERRQARPTKSCSCKWKDDCSCSHYVSQWSVLQPWRFSHCSSLTRPCLPLDPLRCSLTTQTCLSHGFRTCCFHLHPQIYTEASLSLSW